MGKTAKVGIAGKYGARYGTKQRKNMKKIMEKSKKKHKCPHCGKASVKRLGTGHWKCTSCKREFAGGAYLPQTEVGRLSKQAVQSSTPEEMMQQIEDAEEEKK